MKTILIIYWSQTGNTEAMAHAIAQGIEEEGNQAKLLEVSEAEPEILKKANVFALGCPAMGGEVLEEDEMEPFVTKSEPFVSGKVIGLFGSYGWGDGQWMRDWEARMAAAGAKIQGGTGECQAGDHASRAPEGRGKGQGGCDGSGNCTFGSL